MLLHHFTTRTWDALEAACAADGLRLADEATPDVILLDMMLPDISGMEFLRRVRAKKQFEDLPVVILSALADPDTIREGRETGADHYLTKPYLANNLIGTLQDILRTGRKKQAS